MWDLMPGSFHGELEQNIVGDRSALVLPGLVDETPGGASFEILLIALSGDTLFRWSVPYEPIPVDRDHRAWLRDSFAASLAGDYTEGLPHIVTASPEVRNRIRETVADNFWTPRYHPPVREIVAGADSTVWVLRALREPGGADLWEVYDYEGELLGRLAVNRGRSGYQPWAPRIRILHASREHVWATTIDDLDVPYIHRFHVTNACG